MSSFEAVARNLDENTLVVTLTADGTVAFQGKYDQEVFAGDSCEYDFPVLTW